MSHDESTSEADLEASLHATYAIQELSFAHGGVELKLVAPVAAEDLIDEARFAHDEFMPYWADLWPSAMALARYLLDNLDNRSPRSPVIEIGCGLALPSLALAMQGVDVVATDWAEEGLAFARANFLRNGCPPTRVMRFDWRDAALPYKPVPTVIASDVLYERRNVGMLLNLLPRLLRPTGRFILADPGRYHLDAFLDQLKSANWRVLSEASQAEPPRSTIRIFEIVRR